MLAIRLRRTGAKKDAHYRIVVTERSTGRDGRFLEILGHYHPRRQPMEVTFDVDRTDVWIGKGAQMSDTVRALYKMATGGSTVPAEESAPTPVEAPAAAEEAAIETAAAAEASEEGASEPEPAAEADESEVTEDAAGDDADGEAK